MKVMVFGTFDILHEGHLQMLKEAKQLGDHLIVVVARDVTVKEVKGSQPLNNENIRIARLEESSLPHTVRLGNQGDKHTVVSEEKPDIIALGYDQRFFTEGLEKLGITIIRLKPYKPDIYKSSLLKNLKKAKGTT